MKMTARDFFQPLWEEKKYFYKIVIQQILQSFWLVFNIYMTKQLIHVYEGGNMSDFQSHMYIFGGINFLLIVAIIFTSNWTRGDLPHHLLKKIYARVMHRIFLIDNVYWENMGTGKVVSTVDKGAWVWVGFLINVFEIGIRLVFTLGLALLFIYPLGAWYVGIFCVILLGLIFFACYINTFAINIRKQRVQAYIVFQKYFVKIVMSKFEILQNAQMHGESNKIQELITNIQKPNIVMNRYLETMFHVPNIIFLFGTITLFYLLYTGQISLSLVLGLFIVLTLLKENLFTAIDLIKNMTKDGYQIQLLFDLMYDSPIQKRLFEGKEFLYKDGSVQLDNVSFSYGEKKVLNSINLSVSGGKKIAFVGASGGGKTTLVKLISAFLSPMSGKVFIDGQDITTLHLSSYYKNIGYLTQDPSVFDGSVFDNLFYGCSMSREEFLESPLLSYAIESAGCQFIYDFPQGIHTEIGERGVRLSGGQKQRLAIAKLFLKNPKIIILDEPTSALDSASEEIVSRAFEKLFEGKTVFVIAHRLQTVKHVDEIIVIDEGSICERGTHESLMALRGYYYKMVELQSGF